MLTTLLLVAALATPATSMDPADGVGHAPIDHVEASPAAADKLPGHLGAALGSGAGIAAAMPAGIGAATTAGGAAAMVAFSFAVAGGTEPALGVLAAAAVAMPVLFTLPIVVLSSVGAGIGEAAAGGDVLAAIGGGAAGGVVAAGTSLVVTVGSFAAALALSASGSSAGGIVALGGTVVGLGAGIVAGAATTAGVTSLLAAE